MFTDDRPENGTNPSPRTPVVGKRTPDTSAKFPLVPTGLEKLLRLAAIDEGFRRALIDKRGTVAHAAGVSLNGTEAKILAAISAPQLEAMISSLPPPQAPVPPPKTPRISPDLPAPKTRGISPDMPPPKSRGISPDLPPTGPSLPRFDLPEDS